ncbi:type I glyceraldehyde-3-phosphate dehydrogenase [Patescibacteria group bacterium]
MLKVGINGFGRIGRLTTRIILNKFEKSIDLVCINTSGRIDVKGWAHLFKYDSAYGEYKGKVEVKNEKLVVNGKEIPILGEREPKKIPWGKYKAQIIIESTGAFRKEREARQHLKDTVKKIILSAPAKDGNVPMFVIGVNEEKMGNEDVISCASCTTNCVAPVTKVINESFGIKKAFMSTIHAYTSDQKLLDGSHKDLRRARAAAVNIIPTTTGAAKATGKVYAPVAGNFDGLAIRVPVVTGSLTDFTFVTKKKTNIKDINKAFENAAHGKLKGILGATYEPIVSSDIIGLELSTLVDLSLTNVIDGDLVKIIAWYDNEWGYANRLVDEVIMLGSKL